MKLLTKLRFYSFVLLLVCICTNSVFAKPFFVITDLGTLGGGSSHAEAINDKGQVVGYSPLTMNQQINKDTIIHGFIWQKGKLTDIGSLSNFPNSYACDINNKGQVLVNTSESFEPFNNTFLSVGGDPYIWQNGKRTQLPANKGQTMSHINDEGAVVVFCSFSGINNKGHKIINQPLASEILPDGPNKLSTIAILLVGDREIYLGNLGGTYTRAHAINDIGQVVGYSNTIAEEGRAFLWSKGKMVNLGVLPNFLYSSASAINNRGQIVGWLQNAEGKQHAALWQDGKIYDLNTLISPQSGWFLEVATDINKKGQIVGNGFIAGNPHAFLLTPQNQ